MSFGDLFPNTPHPESSWATGFHTLHFVSIISRCKHMQLLYFFSPSHYSHGEGLLRNRMGWAFMQKQQKMETASRDHHFFFLLTFQELTSIAHRMWTGEIRELCSRHFIYFASSDFHTTCIFQKRRVEGHSIRCLSKVTGGKQQTWDSKLKSL